MRWLKRNTNIITILLHAPVKAWNVYRAQSFAGQLLLGVSVLLVVIVLSALPQRVEFSYSTENCHAQSVLLPGLQRVDGNGYTMQFQDELRIGGVSLSAATVCLVPTRAPSAHSERVVTASLWGIPLLAQQGFHLTVPELPVVNYHIMNDGIATARPLTIPLNVTDRIYDYQLVADQRVGACESREQSLSCDIESLQLRQGTKYRLALKRLFQGTLVKTLVDREVTTLSPVSVLESTVKPGETVFTRPTSVAFRMDKRVASATATLEKLEGDTRTAIEQSVRVNGQTIEVAFAELPRSHQYQLTLSNVVAEDGSTLIDKTYQMPFSMSGGPKVTGVNIGRSGVAMGTTVVVTFDQNLSPSQDIGSQTKLGGGIGNMSRSGNQLQFSLASVPLCGDFSISIGKELQSEHGIGGNSAWSFASRTICHTVSTIGVTAKGRAITAYRFGSGPQVIVYVGAIHGNERGTYLLMSEWIDELESRARSIPADKTIIVIPAVNRDGLATGGRRNANNVDLNRNFPTADWKKDVTMPGGEMVSGGGGSTPLSEPESKALASYTQSLSPRLVLTYHSVGWLVTPNEAGVSSSYGSTYSRLSGYVVSPKSQASQTFEYDTTGAYEDWLFEKPAIAAILVELGSHTSSQSSRNFPAMWAMME